MSRLCPLSKLYKTSKTSTPYILHSQSVSDGLFIYHVIGIKINEIKPFSGLFLHAREYYYMLNRCVYIRSYHAKPLPYDIYKITHGQPVFKYT